jgi:hypothetical protein
MMRLVATGAVLLAVFAVSAAAAPAPPATPPCPQVEGWSFVRTSLRDLGGSVDFSCFYSQPRRNEELTLNVLWIKPSVADVHADFRQCGRVSEGESHRRLIWSKSHLAREEYSVTGGTVASNAALFQGDRERIERSAYALLAATEQLAKPCTKKPATPAAKDSQRPAVRVQPAKGAAGSVITFPFTVADNSGRVRVLLTIYDGRAKAKTLLRKDYGLAKSGSYTVKVRAQNAATNLWCITATDAAGNAATACSSLAVR